MTERCEPINRIEGSYPISSMCQWSRGIKIRVLLLARPTPVADGHSDLAHDAKCAGGGVLRAVRICSDLGVSCGAALMWWPLRLMVTSCRPRSSRTILAMADPGGLLEVAGYGQGGHHHGQVSLDGVSGVVEDGRALRSCLLIRKDCPGVPQLVIRGDDLTSVHQVRGDERWRSP